MKQCNNYYKNHTFKIVGTHKLPNSKPKRVRKNLNYKYSNFKEIYDTSMKEALENNGYDSNRYRIIFKPYFIFAIAILWYQPLFSLFIKVLLTFLIVVCFMFQIKEV